MAWDDDQWENLYTPSPGGGISTSLSSNQSPATSFGAGTGGDEWETIYAPQYDYQGPQQQDRDSTWGEWGAANALRMGPSVAGQTIGALTAPVTGPFGEMIGGGLGSALGEGLGQSYEIYKGLRDEYNIPQIGVQGALGAIPFFGAAPGKGAGAKELAEYAGRYASRHAVEGGILGAASTIPTEYAETGHMPSVGQMVAGGAGGATFGYGFGKIGARPFANRAAELAAGDVESGLNAAIKGATTPPSGPSLPPGVTEVAPGLVELTDTSPGTVGMLKQQGFVPAGTSINGKPQMLKGTPIGGSQPTTTAVGGEIKVVSFPNKRDIKALETQGFKIIDIKENGDHIFQRGGGPDIPRNPIVPPSSTIPPDQPLPTPDAPSQVDYPLQPNRPTGPFIDSSLRPDPTGSPFGNFPMRDQPIGPQNFDIPLNQPIGPDYPRQSPGLPPSDLPLGSPQGVPPSDLPLYGPQTHAAIQDLEQKIQAISIELRKLQGTNSPQEAILTNQLNILRAARDRIIAADLDSMGPRSAPDINLQMRPSASEAGGMNLDSMGVNDYQPRVPSPGPWAGNRMSLGYEPLNLDAMRSRQIPEPGPRIQQNEGLNLDLMPVNEAPIGRAPDGQPWASPNRSNMSLARRTGMEDLSIEQLDRMLESGDPDIRGTALAEVERRMTKGNVEYSESVFQDRGPQPSTPITPESGFWRSERGAIDPEDDPILSLIRSLRSRVAPRFNERPPRVPVHGDEQIPSLAFQADEGVATNREFSSNFLRENTPSDIRDTITHGEINRETETSPKSQIEGIATHYPSILEEARTIYSETDPRRIVENLRIISAEERKAWSAMNEAQHARLNRGIPEPPEVKFAFSRAVRLKNLAQAKYEQASTRQLMGKLISDESGHFDPATLVRNLRKMLGREPTDAEVLTAVERAKQFDPNASKQVGPNEWDFTKPRERQLGDPLPDFPRDKFGNRIVTKGPQTPEEIRAWYEKHKDLNSSRLSDEADMNNMPGPNDAIWGPKPEVPPQDKWDEKPLIERPKEPYFLRAPTTIGDAQGRLKFWQNRLEAARKVNNLSETVRSVQKIKEMQNAIEKFKKNTPENPAKLTLIKRLWDEDKGAIDPGAHLGSLWELTKTAYELPRGLLSTLDISATMRQGFPLIGTDAWLKAWKPMWAAMKDEGAYRTIMDEIQNRPMFTPDPITGKSWAQRMGMELPDIDAAGLSAREESMASNLLNKVGPFRASNRAYAAFLNSLRAGTFENLVRDASVAAGKNIIDDPLRNPLLAKQIADYVNTATGRGPLKLSVFGEKEHSLEVMAPILSHALFSPRLLASRVRMLNPGTYIQAPKFVRQQYLNSLARTAGAWGTFATLGAMAGGDVNYWDPTSADFMKIRFGNTRVDPGAGFQQYLTAFFRNASGYFTSSEGRPFELGAGYRAETREDVSERFLENKLQPTLKLGWDLLKASQYRSVYLGDRIAQLFPPMILQDGYELAQTNPELLPFIMPFVAMGMGTQTYEAGEVPSRFVPPESDINYQGGSPFSQHPFHPGGALYFGPQ